MLNLPINTQPKATAVSLSNVVYQVTDLLLARQFMEDFGLIFVSSTPRHLYMRGLGGDAYLYEARLGDTCKFIGAGFVVQSLDELERLASLAGSSAVEDSPAPGGGKHVQMIAPEGFEITALYGQAAVPLFKKVAQRRLNMGEYKPRINSSVRIKRAASEVLRLGHFVLRVEDHDRMVGWLRDHLNLIPSDYLVSSADLIRPLSTFMRCNRGKQLVDHHCLFIIGAGETGVHHCSFEVQDIDALASAHDYLESRGARLVCGIGRHLLGSQIYDYWLDPFGFRVEHYTDSTLR